MALVASLDSRAVAPGLGHTLVLDGEERWWGWGLNAFGPLGDGNAGLEFNRASPFEVVLGESLGDGTMSFIHRTSDANRDDAPDGLETGVESESR